MQLNIHMYVNYLMKKFISLMLQRFIDSSQNGMRSLETRVHGLELALEEISSDLSESRRKVTYCHTPENSCCLLPSAEFLSPKLWRKTQDRYSYSQTSGGTRSLATINRAYKTGNTETKLMNHKFRLHGDGGFTTNPLAEMHTNLGDSRHCKLSTESV